MSTLGQSDGACGQTLGATSSPRAVLAGSGLDIVVADDNANNRFYMNALLKGLGHRVRLAEDGEQAVALVTQQPPDLVIMDMHMPVMDGFTAIQTLRQSGTAAAQVPVVVLTADVRPELMVQTHALGLQGYLFKPLEVQRLLPILQALFPQGGRHALAQAAAPQSPRQEASQTHLNLRMVEDVVRIVKPQGFSEMLLEFSTPEVGNLAQLMARLSAGETLALSGLAHAAKGEAASLGLQLISQLARQAEGFSADVAPAECERVLAQLGAAWEASIAQLDRLGYLASPRTLQGGWAQPAA